MSEQHLNAGKAVLAAAGYSVTPDRRYAADSVLVTILNEDDGYWHAKIFKPNELGDYLRDRAEYDPESQFRVWDINADGVPSECEIVTSTNGFDEHDWAHVAVRVVRCDTGEFVVGTGYRIDGRA